MADTEKLRLLKDEGVGAWNDWRGTNTHIPVDLSVADLSVANLRGANLSGANLRRTNLRGADLSMADLSGANLRGADLNRADLSGADLSGADLSGADLIGADLIGADLIGANLSGADLSGADLIGADLRGAHLRGAVFEMARMGYTVLIDCDLSVAKGLDTVRHDGPSSVGIDTIYRSGGNIPHAFLRGCGVPENFIEYMASLTGRAFEFYSVFISYASANEDVARRIHADLQSSGVRCWFAPHDMGIGQRIRPTIHEAIRVHEKLLLILSRESLASDWVEDEVETALDKEKTGEHDVLFPVRIDDSVMDSAAGWAASLRRRRHIGDFRLWKEHDAYQTAFQRLLRDLRATGAR